MSGGKAFQLVEVKMAPNTKACQSRRETYFDGVCEAENDKLAQGWLVQIVIYTCSNFTDNSINPVVHLGMIVGLKYKPVRVFSSRLEKYSPEVYYS